MLTTTLFRFARMQSAHVGCMLAAVTGPPPISHNIKDLINLSIFYSHASVLHLTMKLSLPWPPPPFVSAWNIFANSICLQCEPRQYFSFQLYEIASLGKKNFLPKLSHSKNKHFASFVRPFFVVTFCSKHYLQKNREEMISYTSYINTFIAMGEKKIFCIWKINNSIFFAFWTHLCRKILLIQARKKRDGRRKNSHWINCW